MVLRIRLKWIWECSRSCLFEVGKCGVNSTIVIRHLLFKITKDSVNVITQAESLFLAILPWNSQKATRKKLWARNLARPSRQCISVRDVNILINRAWTSMRCLQHKLPRSWEVRTGISACRLCLSSMSTSKMLFKWKEVLTGARKWELLSPSLGIEVNLSPSRFAFGTYPPITRRVGAFVQNASARHAWSIWLDRTAIFKVKWSCRREMQNSQIASQKTAMAIDALRHLPTREVAIRERNSKNDPQGLK